MDPRYDYIMSKISYIIEDNDCQFSPIIEKMFEVINNLSVEKMIHPNTISDDVKTTLDKLLMQIDLTADAILSEKIDSHDFDDDEYNLVSALLDL